MHKSSQSSQSSQYRIKKIKISQILRDALKRLAYFDVHSPVNIYIAWSIIWFVFFHL